MPGISSGSGNISPQSMAISPSPDSTSIMLSPISPSPPSGISRTAGSVAGGGDSTTLLFGVSVHRSIRPFWPRTFPSGRSVSVRNCGDPIAADPPGGWGGGGLGKPDRAVWPPARRAGAGAPVPAYDDGVPKAPPPPPAPPPLLQVGSGARV